MGVDLYNGGFDFASQGYPQASGGGGGMSDIWKFLSASGGSGFSPLSMGMNFGGQLLGGIAGLLRGKSDSQKAAKSIYGLAKNRMGQNVIDPSQYMAEYMRSMLPEWNRSAQALDKRLGLDSGVAAGALAESRESSIANFLLQAKMMNDQLKSRNDQFYMSLMGDMAGRM